MALTSILRDFEVRSGLIVEGINIVTSSTGMTGTLQVNGGAAIAKNLAVGSIADFWGTSTVHNEFIVERGTYLTAATATGIVSVTNNTQATTIGAGALKVTGGVYVGNNVVISGTAASTSTTSSNALYVAGGVGIGNSLVVGGPTIFRDQVVFSGTATYVYSTNTFYTDNILELHTPPGGDGAKWDIDDGKDIGVRFRYYANSTDTNAALVLANDTKYLEWYSSGAEGTSTFAGASYGIFKTGGVRLVGGAVNNNNTTTGDLQVLGGVGIAGSVYATNTGSFGSVRARDLTQNRLVFVGADGRLVDDADLTYDPVTNLLTANISSSNTATSLAGGATGSIPYQSNPGVTTFLPIGTAGYVLVSDGTTPTWNTTGTVVSGEATTSTNLKFGAQYQIPYQTAVGATAFEAGFEYNYTSNTFSVDNALINAFTDASSTATGSLQVRGGVGINKNIFVGGSSTIVGNEFINGGTLGTNQTTFNLVNTTATTVNLAGAATSVVIGSNSAGTTNIRNIVTVTTSTEATATNAAALVVTGGVGVGGNIFAGGNAFLAGDIWVNGGDFYTSQTTFNLLNTTATTINFGGAATALTIGATTGGTTIRNATTVFDSTDASSTATGALQVYGGAGINRNLFVGGSETLAGNLFVNGGTVSSNQTTVNLFNTTATTINFGGAATALTIGNDTTGTTTIRNITYITTTTNSTAVGNGALVVSGGIGVGGAMVVASGITLGGNLAANGGNILSSQTSFNLLNATVTTLNFAGAATAITIGATTGYTQIRNQTTVTNTTNATSTNTGALTVQGGVGIAQDIWVGGAARVVGATTLNNLSAAVSTVTQLTVGGSATVGGIIYANDSSNANATTNGSLRVAGGVGIIKDVVIGGSITAGATAAASSGTVVNGFYSNNTLIASFTSNTITGTGQVDLDFFSSVNYRSARYFVQITDGANIHISEISLFHDGTKAYINEYGIATNNGQLGSFDAALGGGNVTVKFTPTGATAMVIKMVRTTISA